MGKTYLSLEMSFLSRSLHRLSLSTAFSLSPYLFPLFLSLHRSWADGRERKRGRKHCHLSGSLSIITWLLTKKSELVTTSGRTINGRLCKLTPHQFSNPDSHKQKQQHLRKKRLRPLFKPSRKKKKRKIKKRREKKEERRGERERREERTGKGKAQRRKQ